MKRTLRRGALVLAAVAGCSRSSGRPRSRTATGWRGTTAVEAKTSAGQSQNFSMSVQLDSGPGTGIG